MLAQLREHQTPLADLAPSTDSMCRWDAENAAYIVELKNRPGKQYPDTLIERSKYDALLAEAETSGRKALYVVQSAGRIYIWNLTRLARLDYNFKWHTRGCRATTEFANTGYINKEVGYLQWTDARVVIDVNP